MATFYILDCDNNVVIKSDNYYEHLKLLVRGNMNKFKLNIPVYDVILNDFISLFKSNKIIIHYEGMEYSVKELLPIANDLRVVNITKIKNILNITVIDNTLFKVYYHYRKINCDIIFKEYYSNKMADHITMFSNDYFKHEVTSIDYLPMSDRLLITFKGDKLW